MKKLYKAPDFETVGFESNDLVTAISGFVTSEGIEDGGEAAPEG